MEVEDFLDHHGIKGMRWGVRNEKKTPRTDAQKKSRNKKIKWGVYYAGVGALATVAILQSRGKLPVSAIKKTPQSHEAAQRFLDARKAQHMSFVREYNARQNLINAGANEDLKNLYRLAETPIRNRGYLPAWK